MAATTTREDALLSEKTRRTDEEVFDKLQRALHDIGPLLEFNTSAAPIHCDTTTTTRLSIADYPRQRGPRPIPK